MAPESKLLSYTAQSPDDDIPQTFVNFLESDIKEINNELKFPKKMNMTPVNKLKEIMRIPLSHLTGRC